MDASQTFFCTLIALCYVMPQLLAVQKLLEFPTAANTSHCVTMGEYVRAAQDDVQPFCFHNQGVECS